VKGDIKGSVSGSGGLLDEAASATNPSLAPNHEDPDTGVGSSGSDSYSAIAGGIEGIRLTEASDHILIDNELHAGITAGTTQTQAGGFQILSSYNEVSTVATTDDTVVMPEARAGRECEIINNGANTLQIFPAVGDDIGAGVDQPEQLEANEVIAFRAYDSTNWHVESSTEIIHAEMHDEDNTDAFVVSDAGLDFQSYHTNGMSQGGTVGWTFDAGGAGTSFPIASIADGADSGVDIAVTTTGSHGLAAGDVISQSNLSDSAYVGIFVVKAIISSTIYEVAAVYTATGTGTMDQAATLTCNVGSSGAYLLTWTASATSATNNETFDFLVYNGATSVTGTKVRRKFGTANDFGSFGGSGILTCVDGDKISVALSNEDSAGNVTIRNFVMALVRL
jgi:hypothetical protein